MTQKFNIGWITLALSITLLLISTQLNTTQVIFTAFAALLIGFSIRKLSEK